MRSFLVDLAAAFQRAPLIWYMAISETKARYRRSVLGPWWLTIGAAVGVAGLGIVWSTLLKVPLNEFVPSLTVGMLLWQLISSTVVEGCAVFTRQSQIIRNLPLPLLMYPAQLVVRQIITFAHNLLVLVVVFVIFPPTAEMHLTAAILGFVLVLVNLMWIALLLGMLGGRFRDIEQIISTVMPLVFFLTPVLYKADKLGFGRAIVWLNPFSYFIAVVRDPLLGNIPELRIYIVFGAITLCGWLVAALLFVTRRSRIPYWV
jgi:ABC-type polysaccharide/polyol phosphate export permease